MKKIRIYSLFLVAIAVLASESCKIKHDCRGRIKHRLANGIWI